jgi:hypothetical protein
VWLFLVPLGCIYAGIGLSLLIARVAAWSRIDPLTTSAGAAVVFAGVFGAMTIRSGVIVRSPETGTLLDAASIASHLITNVRPGDRIVAQSPSGPSLDYYLLVLGGERSDQINARASRGRVFVVVNPRHLQTMETVRADQRNVPWSELVEDGPPVRFPWSVVHTLRFPAVE